METDERDESIIDGPCFESTKKAKIGVFDNLDYSNESYSSNITESNFHTSRLKVDASFI